MVVVFIDFQGFVIDRKSFIIKELSVLNNEELAPEHYLFKPPQDIPTLPHCYQLHTNWLTRNFHGLDWSGGFEVYEELQEILLNSTQLVERIYVKGKEKQRYLSKKLLDKTIVNLEDLGCPSLDSLSNSFKAFPCDNHLIRNTKCSLKNVQNLLSWYNEHKADIELSFTNETNEEEVSCSCFGV